MTHTACWPASVYVLLRRKDLLQIQASTIPLTEDSQQGHTESRGFLEGQSEQGAQQGCADEINPCTCTCPLYKMVVVAIKNSKLKLGVDGAPCYSQSSEGW